MIFSSSLFLFLFLPLFLLLYNVLPLRLRSLWLLLASWVFYAWWRVDFLALLVGVSTGAWLLGKLIARNRDTAAAKVLVGAGAALCVGALAYFKYANFGIESANTFLGLFGVTAIPVLSLALPIGVSFYLFKAIAYMMDVYRGKTSAGGWISVATYVAIFPQVISGPIDRYGELAPQLEKDGRSFELFSSGAQRFMVGFSKKVLVADMIAPLANAAFALARPTMVDGWLGAAAYTMQLYFDFSGYSDMAIGLGRMMGLRFMENFRAPYLSASITEFWRRWHISLSSWLRDYLYISLGGNRRGRARTLVNLFLVMVIGGLWHGAALTFVVWGAWHGALLLVERLRGERHLTQRLPRPLAVAFTMLLVCIGWVFFRASSVAGAGAMFAGMMGLHGVGLSAELRWQVGGLSIVALAVAWVATFMGPWLAKSAEGSESAGYRGGGAAGGWRRALSGLQVAAVPLFVIAMVKVLAESSPIFLYGKF